MRWFKYMANMRNDLFIKELRLNYGLEGKAVWDLVLEIYTDACGHSPGEPVEFELEVFRKEIGISRKSLEKFLDFFAEKKKILREISGKKLILNIPRMAELRDNYSKDLQVTCKQLAPKKTEDRRQNIEKETTTPTPPSSGVGSGQFFKIKRKEIRSCESDWIIESLKELKSIKTNYCEIEIFLKAYPSCKKIYNRWMHHDIARRMSAYYYTLSKTGANNELKYALAMADKSLKDPLILGKYIDFFRKALQENDFEVEYNV